MTSLRSQTINKLLLYFTVLSFPLNLGYHFILNNAYVNGLLMDYLVPTIYLQDILALGFVLFNFRRFDSNFLVKYKFLVWFLFSYLLAAVFSPFIAVSISLALRLVIYALFAYAVFATFERDFLREALLRIFCIQVVLLSILAFAQWLNQGSVFNNYLFFGEQPYAHSTFGIHKENFFSSLKIPPYGTFRHPNTFGGYFSLVLVYIFYFYTIRKSDLRLLFIFLMGVVTTFLTFSYFSWLSLIIGCLYILISREKIFTFLSLLFLIASFFIHLLPFRKDVYSVLGTPSFYRRADLLNSAYRLIPLKPLTGFGPGTSSAYIDALEPIEHDIRFAQPPHNIFVLLALESGLITVLLFTVFFIQRLFLKYKSFLETSLGLASLLQIMILGSFDHYLITMQQTSILFWLLLLF